MNCKPHLLLKYKIDVVWIVVNNVFVLYLKMIFDILCDGWPMYDKVVYVIFDFGINDYNGLF